MRNAKNLRNSNTYKKVFISPDLLPKEREVNKLLHQELKRRKEAGEVNLIIRRGKIISKQVSSDSATETMDSSTTKNQ